MPTLAEHRAARADYEILEDYEAGLALLGHEVKSVRAGAMRLKGSFVKVVRGSLWLINAYVPKYSKASATVVAAYDPYRSRALLVRARELKRILQALQTEGRTVVPLSVYTAGRYIKIKIAVARGRRTHEKRAVIKKRDVEREIRRHLKGT